ncbi:hypothetical protein [Aestuariivirga sp.]|uniref:hypothetical protein n=1 Tax=Aestuariivirga sp. TaxID=2650926 RepID=UPI0039E70DC7
MKRKAAPVILSGLCLLLTVCTAVAAPVAQQAVPRPTKPVERCQALETQASALLKAHPDLGGDRAQADLGKARSLCASGKPAQGLRYYVKGLHLMGAQPNLPKP